MIRFSAILFFCIAMVNTLFANEVFKKLDDRMKQTNSLVCVGLDPDPSKMPLSLTNFSSNLEDTVFAFLSEVVDITAPQVCAYKIQKAFFDQFDDGHILLRNICAYIHQFYPDIPIFIDCKIGDTDNTMKAYMHLLFEDIKADGVVINPYMGDDVFEPFLNDPHKVALVLVQTSNPNAKVVQEIALENGRKLWEEILDLTLARWNKNGNMIPILSSNTSMNNYTSVRKVIPQDVPILLAGIGSQGGNPEVMNQLLNQDKRGVFVNSSRGILYPYNPSIENWKEEVLKAVLDLKFELNKIRFGESSND